MKKQKPKVYMNEKGEFLILRDRVPANEHDRIYIYELPLNGKKTEVVETMLSPGKSGFKCLGAL